MVKHNINQREISEQGSELLKFDKLEDIQENKDEQGDLYIKSILDFVKQSLKIIDFNGNPEGLINLSLITINKYSHYKTRKTIPFIDELFPMNLEKKNDKSAK